MPVKIEDLPKGAGAALPLGDDAGIVITSRVRLARNLAGRSFPGWSATEECTKVWEETLPVVLALSGWHKPQAARMDELSAFQRQILFERHLVSREHAEGKAGRGVVFQADEAVSVMINEEDHVRMQTLLPGLQLQEAWRRSDALDTGLEQQVSYAFSTRWGYLTACPSNVGTGMRASVMLHVPGLVLMEEIHPIIKGLGKIGLAVRGLWGEGTEATGHMFQISNQVTLGDLEVDLVSTLEQIVQELVQHEKNARIRLMESKENTVRDHVGRAFGILSNAHVLTSKEALDLLSSLRLGIDLGILGDVRWEGLNDLLMQTRPAHLQVLIDEQLNPQERDEARARLVRSRMQEAVQGPAGGKD